MNEVALRQRLLPQDRAVEAVASDELVEHLPLAAMVRDVTDGQKRPSAGGSGHAGHANVVRHGHELGHVGRLDHAVSGHRIVVGTVLPVAPVGGSLLWGAATSDQLLAVGADQGTLGSQDPHRFFVAEFGGGRDHRVDQSVGVGELRGVAGLDHEPIDSQPGFVSGLLKASPRLGVGFADQHQQVTGLDQFQDHLRLLSHRHAQSAIDSDLFEQGRSLLGRLLGIGRVHRGQAGEHESQREQEQSGMADGQSWRIHQRVSGRVEDRAGSLPRARHPCHGTAPRGDLEVTRSRRSVARAATRPVGRDENSKSERIRQEHEPVRRRVRTRKSPCRRPGVRAASCR